MQCQWGRFFLTTLAIRCHSEPSPMVPVQREIAQGHTNEDALALGIIRGAIAKLGQSYSINRLLRQPELLVQSGGAGAEWTRQVAGLIESGDKAVIANSAQALMRRGYSGEEALALALMPEKPESFLINGFRALAQNGEIQRDILLSRIAPQVYREAQVTDGPLNIFAPEAMPRSRDGTVLDLLQNTLDRSERLIERNDIVSASEDYIQIGKSVGAKAGNYDIMDLDTGEKFQFVEGTRIQDVEVFAGYGSKTVFRDAEKYAASFGGDAENWQHVKGFAWIATDDGDRRAEVHWVQCPGVGKYNFFVKEWLD